MKKLAVTTDMTTITRSTDADDDDDDVIYCPMPFQPDSYSVCCTNAADEMRCCQKDAPATQELSYVYRLLQIYKYNIV